MPKLSPMFFDYTSYPTGPSGYVEREKARYRSMDRASLLQLLERKRLELPLKRIECEHIQVLRESTFLEDEIRNIEAEISTRLGEAPAPESAPSSLPTPAGDYNPGPPAVDTLTKPPVAEPPAGQVEVQGSPSPRASAGRPQAALRGPTSEGDRRKVAAEQGADF